MTTTFSARVRASREKLGLNQKELGEKIGVTSSAISNYENRAEGNATGDNLFALADALGVSARWLATGTDDGVVFLPKLVTHPAVIQSIACLEAFLATGGQSQDLVRAALTLLKTEIGAPAEGQASQDPE
jgi:transcriptional regulator with XRE-family HTH domain